MNNNLLILGAGQYGTVAKEIAQAMACFDRIDFLDDIYSGTVLQRDGKSVVGRLTDFEKLTVEYSCATVAIGNAELRLMWLERLEKAGYTVPTLVSPRSFVSPSAVLKPGVIIEPMASVNANSVVDTGSYISLGAAVNHNAFVSAGCHCDCNCTVESNAVVPRMTKVAAGCAVRPGA